MQNGVEVGEIDFRQTKMISKRLGHQKRIGIVEKLTFNRTILISFPGDAPDDDSIEKIENREYFQNPNDEILMTND